MIDSIANHTMNPEMIWREELMQLPNRATTLVQTMFHHLFPIIEEELDYWKEKAQTIPNEELRKQALTSIEEKRFHCQGGAVFALLAGDNYKKAIQFIVAYQTISDYLDNLCDRSTSLDPLDFRMLHESMEDALTPERSLKNYYAYRKEQDDGGYLHELVQTCQHVVEGIPGWERIKLACLQLETLYADLQVHKHVKMEERVPRLTNWYQENKEKAVGLSWYEFAAATGSTLGIYCLVSYALAGKLTNQLIEQVRASYFPSVHALHILLDYYIDQAEDEEEGDLNFCSYYRDDVELLERLQFFLLLAQDRVKGLPDSGFHQLIPKGLVALYLSDKKIKTIDQGRKNRRKLLKISGVTTIFIHYSIRFYNRIMTNR